MTSEEIRKRFINFFKYREHKVLPSASLVPENDPTVLFTTAGMQPLIPYLMGAPHPEGKKLVNVQKCVRTQDIEEVGDNTHDTFFEMLGNWSLGSYFKEEAIKWSYEFITSKEEGLGLDPNRLYITCFEGNDDAPQDEKSAEVWKSLGVSEKRIYFLGAKDNWWSPGDNGPCGPDTEMFYDLTKEGLGDLSREEFLKATDEQKIVEFWNDVFMEYKKDNGKVTGKLKQQNVDTGAGLERLAMLMQRKHNIFDTDLFEGIMSKIKDFSLEPNTKAMRIVADHIRTSVFLIADGVTPSNTDQGYILRRLLRRAIISADKLKMKSGDIALLADVIIEKYKNIYSNLKEKEINIKREINDEENRFRKTLERGMKEFEKTVKVYLNKELFTETIPGDIAFKLQASYGFPIELTIEMAKENKINVDLHAFEEEIKKHQKLSRSGAEQKFKGGLGDTGEMSVKYHTATHLLHQALRDVLGDKVYQKGSNITPERLRFDFSYGEKMTVEQKKLVEDLINDKIQQSLPVTYEDLSLEEAKKKGAIGLFEEKYGDKVRVYKIGNFSLEFCGGPHVSNTKELGIFKIEKEEAISAGIRRIKATLK